MADQDVSDYLTTWGLQEYINIFKENKVTLRALAVMTADIARDLIPAAGDRSIFMSNLQQWRTIFQASVSELSVELDGLEDTSSTEELIVTTRLNLPDYKTSSDISKELFSQKEI